MSPYCPHCGRELVCPACGVSGIPKGTQQRGPPQAYKCANPDCGAIFGRPAKKFNHIGGGFSYVCPECKKPGFTPWYGD